MMTWRDRDGTVREGDPPTFDDYHSAHCVGGWLGQDVAGRLIPCRACKPHLRRRFGRRGR